MWWWVRSIAQDCWRLVVVGQLDVDIIVVVGDGLLVF